MARVKLLPTTVRSLPGIPGKWATYSDTVTPGLELRISPKGSRVWSMRFWWRGRHPRLSLGSLARVGLAEARTRAREAQDQAGRGIDPRRDEADTTLTVASLGRLALAALELKDSTRREWTRVLEVEVIPELGGLVAADLERFHIRDLGAAIVKRGAPSTAIAAFEVLRRVYSWGVARDHVRGTPFVGLEPPAQRRASSRWLSTAELRAVWAALAALEQLAVYDRPGVGRGHGWRRGLLNHDDYADATRLLILTAARREMVLGMRRSELEALDTPEARWIVPAARMKGGLDHVTPLSPQAHSLVKRRLSGGHRAGSVGATEPDLLFPAGRGAKGSMTWSSRFVADLREIVDLIAGRELERWTIHGLRHSIATHMTEDLGVDVHVVDLILSHRLPGITGRYNRAERLAERREALTRWAAWVEGLVR